MLVELIDILIRYINPGARDDGNDRRESREIYDSFIRVIFMIAAAAASIGPGIK